MYITQIPVIYRDIVVYILEKSPMWNLLIVQQDATYSVHYISVRSLTCFGCWHPSSGAGTAVITACGID